ncbi:globoside alpha-1,3-N-acetylgalactosaminyltransferase 1-like isoform X2 [Carassius auratus]|uniref:Globoside alpha-1,3-N-acetylgalactosaminyltransferase 1-like isoform X2 n=1 Tax=Carassius auratus TaxID=7957 RepID=A0A6P6K2L3_CARAU|nr:globoside alpha-1,3-N-acetylgalactosaminyltransferase 1-like isoform X2 [Carassius auratus]
MKWSTTPTLIFSPRSERTNTGMTKFQNMSTSLLVLAGISVIGLIFWGYNPLSFGYKEIRLCPNLTQEHQENSNLQSPQGLSYNQPSVVGLDGKVIAVTPWLAPIVWEGTFDSVLIDSIYKQQNITIATTVFALGKYTQFLKVFLESAELNYFVGFRVHYYLFTDHPEQVPTVKLGHGRQLTVLKVASSNRWQEITLRRMEKLEKLIESRLVNEADYVFSLDVDTKFYGPWGAESLGRLIGVIHPGYYQTARQHFPYERRPQSQAYIPVAEGDYYYGGAVIGGSVKDVHKVAKTCREQLDIDAANSIEAAWQEESHLNKYFLYNKPSKVLSPEYLWQDFKPHTNEVKIIRFSQVIKNYAAVRPNP